MDLFPLTLFPDGGLASSVITTVWVGVFVLCFFNLRYGWVLSGLVVPGYLVPLVIVKPIAAVVIVIEAILTYLIVWVFSEKLSRGRFPALFGRDRFMGLILASIAVRLSMDGYILPEVADWMQQNFDRRLDWQDNLQSFGLVIISLLANQFWKPGLGRGMVAAVVTIGLTWLIVRYGLMEFTNFRMSGVTYLYEGLASSILASPKAYIILTLTAMIASQVNVRYGWDFSGILIPALIALQWYQPTKVLTSFGEAIVIYLIARMVLKLPMLANVTMEGGRKLLLFFNISFAWKMLLGWSVVWLGYDVKTTDFYGFGYLLSTLIAIKAHDKDIFPRLARSTLQVSLAGAVFGNIFGFALSAAATRVTTAIAPTPEPERGQSRTPLQDALVVKAVGDAYARSIRAEARPLSAEAAETLSDLIELFEAGVPASSPAFNLTASDWRVQRIEQERFAIVRADGAGEELLVFDPAGNRELAILLADPTQSPGLALAAQQLQQNQQPRWLVITAPSPATAINSRDVATVFRAASSASVLSLEANSETDQSRAVFANRAASALDLAKLRQAIPDLQVDLQAMGAPAGGNQGVVSIGLGARLAMARARIAANPSAQLTQCTLPRFGNISEGWSDFGRLAYLRFEIAEPMLASIGAEERPDLARAASSMGGFELGRCRLGGRTHWLLSAPFREEGFALVAEGGAPERIVLSYRDATGTLPARVGAAVYREWDADVLLIAPQTDSLFRPAQTTFDVMWQETLRQQKVPDGISVFQIRAAPDSTLPYDGPSELVVARDRVGAPDAEFEPLVSALRTAGLRAELVGTGEEWAGFEKRPATATRYLQQTTGRRYAMGWLFPTEAPQ